ncbi:hypothetical protein [Nakamurella endophytica]|uniref:Uncharacterized protein n=1 Tax=Nakamurella endophytica TaxID=1748367 RepID=A0A917TA85_9ACTN|nr:hypothetical protein [Nakamurella endophytica]GGM16233.1 hypothetical protein GCM10011594_40320 [Nakamurella endophytica]
MSVQRPHGDRTRPQFVRYLRSKTDLITLCELRPNVYEVQMRGGTHIATLVDYYLLSESDVLEICEADPDADAIVNTGPWNTYTPEARALAISRNVGLYNWREFMRAVHYAGDVFLAGGPRAGTGWGR